MKNFFYILLFLSFASFSNAHAAPDLNVRCKGFAKTPEVSVKAVFEPLKYDHSKVSRTLSRLHNQEYGESAHRGYQVQGLSTYQLGTELEFIISKRTFNDGVTCFYPEDIKLLIVMKEPTIYIARSLKKGTCAYNIALRHEQTHQQINMEVIEHFVPLIKERFLQTVKKYSLASREKDDITIEQAQKGLKDRYLAAINPLIDEIKSEIGVEQQKLDRLEQYDYEQSLCQ
ncbi:MAG: hypothetical protein IJS26_00575 [Alphaproteobacteria bacterium]|nr:hypothetical protein [Alphaproteobacteria bacterium]